MLLELGWELERIHSVRRLTAIAADYRVPFVLSPDDIDFLDEIYRGRYPAESGLLPLGDPTAADAQRAVTLANKNLASLHMFFAARSQPKAPQPAEGASATGDRGAPRSPSEPDEDDSR